MGSEEADAIEELRTFYELIVIDSAPVLIWKMPVGRRPWWTRFCSRPFRPHHRAGINRCCFGGST